MKHKLRGTIADRRVWLDDAEIWPDASYEFRNHSPDGFNWGYGGSGPAQLALAVCIELFHNLPSEIALGNYQNFKWKVIAKLPQTDFEIEFDYVRVK